MRVSPRQSIRAAHSGACHSPGSAARARASGHPGRVWIQSPRAVAQGRNGADAVDAGHRAEPRREQSMGSGAEHSRRDGLPSSAARRVPTETRSSHSPPTTRAPAPLRSMGAGYRRIARRATTSVRSAPRRAKARPRPARSSSSTRPSRSRWPRRAPDIPPSARRRDLRNRQPLKFVSDELLPARCEDTPLLASPAIVPSVRGSRVSIVLVLLSTATLAGQTPEALPQALTQMIETERAFAARALVIGWKQAFLEYFAPDAMGFDRRSGRARARATGQGSRPADGSPTDLGAALRRRLRQRRARLPHRPRSERPRLARRRQAALFELRERLEAATRRLVQGRDGRRHQHAWTGDASHPASRARHRRTVSPATTTTRRRRSARRTDC